MEITEGKPNKKCEMGRCRKRADVEVRIERMGIRSTLCMCRECAKELYETLGTLFVPKSVETIRSLRRGSGGAGKTDCHDVA